MTLIAGYIYKDSAGIIADTAVTFSSQSGDKSSDNTFGIINDGNDLVRETAHKIVNIRNKILIAGAGRTRVIASVIDDIDIHLKYLPNRPLEPLIKEHITKTDDEEQFIAVCFLEDKPLLIHKNESGYYTNTREDWVIVNGGGGRFLAFQNVMFILSKICRDSGRTEMETLISKISYMEIAALNFDTYNKGIGGIFNGAILTKEGVKWAHDRKIITYYSNSVEIAGEIVSVHNRNEGLIIVSNKTGTRILINSNSLDDNGSDNWIEENYVGIDYLSMESNYFVLAAKDNLIITIIIKGNRENISDLINIDYNKQLIKLDGCLTPYISSLTQYHCFYEGKDFGLIATNISILENNSVVYSTAY